MTERYRRKLKDDGVRLEMVEQQVEEIVKIIQDHGFTLNESLLIAKMLSNDIEQARYHSEDTLLSAINVKRDHQQDHL